MELFTATGKMGGFFFLVATRGVRCVHHWWCHTRVNMLKRVWQEPYKTPCLLTERSVNFGKVRHGAVNCLCD